MKKLSLYAGLGLACAVFVVLTGFKPKPTKKAVAASRPNIIIILTDDMGFSDVGCFGGNFVPTPNIDRIAKNGRKFTQYYSAAPICSPSRAGMLTGMNPARWNFSTFLDNKKHNKNAE